MKRLLIVVPLSLVLITSVLAYVVSPPFRYATWVLFGRSKVCPIALAIRCRSNEETLMAAKDRILRASQLVSKDQELELWNTPRGRYWIPKGNRFVLPFNLAEMEAHIYGTGAHAVQPGDIVLDCGASDGDYARQALDAGARLVVSIEISPSAVECLRRNLAEPISQGRAIICPKGVWNEEGSMTLNVSDTNFAANSLVLHPEGSHPGMQVELTTIDAIVGELGLPHVDVIKMDIEGAELMALAGARKTITRFKPRLSIATEHLPDDEVTIPAAVRNIRPDYRMTCGPCSVSGSRIRPDVVYFD